MAMFSWPLHNSPRQLSIVGGEVQDSEAHVRRGGGFAIDIAAVAGTPFYPVLPSGAIGYIAANQWDDECGWLLELNFNWGGVAWQERFCHAQELLVTGRAVVYETSQLGLVGQTGHATGPHIHLVLWRDGVRVRPEDYLLDASPGSGETDDPRTMDRDRISRALDIIWGWSSAREGKRWTSPAAREVRAAVIAIKQEVGLE